MRFLTFAVHHVITTTVHVITTAAAALRGDAWGAPLGDITTLVVEL